MKYLCIIILFAFCFCKCLSQEISNHEYEIYGKIIGENGYQFYPINFGISSEFKEFPIKKDSIYEEIKKISMKDINYKRLILESLPYSIGKTYSLTESDKSIQIFLSPIYFKKANEAYFILIIQGLLPHKPIFSFLQAFELENDWIIRDYYIIN